MNANSKRLPAQPTHIFRYLRTTEIVSWRQQWEKQINLTGRKKKQGKVNFFCKGAQKTPKLAFLNQKQ